MALKAGLSISQLLATQAKRESDSIQQTLVSEDRKLLSLARWQVRAVICAA